MINNIEDPVIDRQVKQAMDAIAAIELAWGSDHQRLMPALKNLADLYFAVGMYFQSENVYWRYLSITAKNFGDTHPIVAGSLQYIGETFEAQGLFPEAERYYLFALDARRRAESSVDELVEPFARLINLYRQNGDERKALLVEEQLHSCLKVRQIRRATMQSSVTGNKRNSTPVAC